MKHGYPLIEMEHNGEVIPAYRVDLNAAILLIPKRLIDSGETTIELEIQSFLRPRQ